MARLSTSLSAALANVAGGEFMLVELGKDGPKPIYDQSGELLCFRTGEEAENEAMRQSDMRGNKVQPRRAVDKDWKSRETARTSPHKKEPYHRQVSRPVVRLGRSRPL